MNMNDSVESELIGVVEDILNLDPLMRFTAIIDLDGNIIEGIMKDGKTSLESQKEQEKFCKEASERRQIRESYNNSLGKIRYVHLERENVTQITIYPKTCTILVTMEPELSIDKKLVIITKIKKITSHL
jgi:hypothetical protein